MDFQSFFNSIRRDSATATESKEAAPVPAAAPEDTQRDAAAGNTASDDDFRGQILAGEDAVLQAPTDLESLVQPAFDPVTIYKGGFGAYTGQLITASGAYICYAVRKGSLRAINLHTAQNTQLKGLTKDQPRDVQSPATRIQTSSGPVDRVSAIGADGRLMVWDIETPEGTDPPLSTVVCDVSLAAKLHLWRPESDGAQNVCAVAAEDAVALIDVSKAAEDPRWVPMAGAVTAMTFVGSQHLAVAVEGALLLLGIGANGLRGPVQVSSVAAPSAISSLLTLSTGEAGNPATILVGTHGNATLTLYALGEDKTSASQIQGVTFSVRSRNEGNAGAHRQACFLPPSSSGPGMVLVTDGEGLGGSRSPLLTVLSLGEGGKFATAAFFPLRVPVVSAVGGISADAELQLKCFQTTRVQLYRVPLADCYTTTVAAPAPSHEALGGDGDSASGVAKASSNGDADTGAGSSPPSPPAPSQPQPQIVPSPPSLPQPNAVSPPAATVRAGAPASSAAPDHAAADASAELQPFRETIAAQEQELASLREQLAAARSAPSPEGRGTALPPTDAIREEVARAIRELLPSLQAIIAQSVTEAISTALPAAVGKALRRSCEESVVPSVNAAGDAILSRLDASVVRGLCDIRDAATPNFAAFATQLEALMDLVPQNGNAHASPSTQPLASPEAPKPRNKVDDTATLLSGIYDCAQNGDADGALAMALQAAYLPLLLMTLRLPQMAGLWLHRGHGDAASPARLRPTTQLCLMQQLLMAFGACVKNGGPEVQLGGLTPEDGAMLVLQYLGLLVPEFKPDDTEVRPHAAQVLRSIKDTMEAAMRDRGLRSDISTKAEVIFLRCRMASSS